MSKTIVAPISMGTSMLFHNSLGQVLLFLRDDKKDIPYPNCWDLLGGKVEHNESPDACIIRELEEEIEYCLRHPKLYRVTQFVDRVEHTFVQYVQGEEIDPAKTPLHEGQRLKWFSKEEFRMLPADRIAFGFRPLVLEFLEKLG